MLSHLEVLRQAGFEEVEQYDFPTRHVWTLDSFLGSLYSTSFASVAWRTWGGRHGS